MRYWISYQPLKVSQKRILTNRHIVRGLISLDPQFLSRKVKAIHPIGRIPKRFCPVSIPSSKCGKIQFHPFLDGVFHPKLVRMWIWFVVPLTSVLRSSSKRFAIPAARHRSKHLLLKFAIVIIRRPDAFNFCKAKTVSAMALMLDMRSRDVSLLGRLT